MVTAEPLGAFVPLSGFWEITKLFSTVEEELSLLLTTKPAFSSVFFASSYVTPVAFGTLTPSSPALTVSVITVPGSTMIPSSTEALIT